jgi:NAD(P)-dependent dehydrogenase (short-subunit alcohol dehydrogenase family)
VNTLDLFRLDGRRALVTGASRGLGREMALAFADAGADVVITGRTPETLTRTADEIRERGRQAWTRVVDMGVPEACEAACEAIRDELGPIDLNLTSVVLPTRIFGAAMLADKRPGRIINIASISGLIANRGIGGRDYETSKAAVIHFTRCAAVDWAPHRITVNAICPGLFMTDVNREWNERRPDVIDAFVSNVPMGRAGEPPEIGPLAVYLASPASAYVTGAAIVIDGGYTAW